MDSHLDADILIWSLRGRSEADDLLTHFRSNGDRLMVGMMQRVEVLFHMRPGEEVATFTLLEEMESHPLTTDIVELAATLFRRWRPSHGTGVNDALLAATALIHGGRIVTQNVRHFPMPGLIVERGWP